MAVNIGSIKAFFGLDPTPAVKGMKTATKAVRTGTKQINTSLRSIKRLAATAFVGWGVGALGKDFVNAAMDMDSMRKSMAAAVGGMEKGRREINYLRETSLDMGLSFRAAGRDFKQLSAAAKGTALEGEGIRKVWRSLQNATVALQLTTAETSGTVFAFKDMLSKGTVQAEELKRQLGNRLPGAFKMAADAMGMTTKELAKQMKLGNLMADEFLPALAKAMDKTYAGAAVEASKSMRAEMNKMKSAWFDFQALFMETTGLSNVLAMAMKKVTKTLVSFNNGMGKLAKFVAVVNMAFTAFMGNAISSFIVLRAKLEKFVNAMQFAGSTIAFIGKEAWVGFKYNALIALNVVANTLRKVVAEMKESLADFVFWTADKMHKIMPKSVTVKLLELSDALRSSSQKNRKTINDESEALRKRKEEEQNAIKVGMTYDQFKNNSIKITNKETNALKENNGIIKSMQQDTANLYKARLKMLAGRQDMPEVGGGIPEVDLSRWEIAVSDLEKSFAKLGKTSTDIAKNIQGVFTTAFKGIEDALVQLVVKGKIDWRSLADAMISDMVRVAARQAITGPLAMAFSAGMGQLQGMFSNTTPFNASGAGFAANPAEATAMRPFANGGTITEPVFGVGQKSGATYSFAEKGPEEVLNQNQIKSMGSNKSVAVSVRPQINITTPPGTQATTQQSSDGMNIDVLITALENKMSANMRRGGGFADAISHRFGLNSAAGANR